MLHVAAVVQAAALLAEMDGDDADDVTSVAFEYGKHIGLAFQVWKDRAPQSNSQTASSLLLHMLYASGD